MKADVGIAAILFLVLGSCKPATVPQQVEDAPMSFAPAVPPAVARKQAKHLIVNLTVTEEERPLSDGVMYEFWSYNGHTPGPFIRLRVGDTFEVRLDNSRAKLTHTVDFHAVTGPGGGAGALMANPGEKSAGTFKALNPGIYIYHCAAPPIPAHIANGLYGLVLVEPEDGLPKVDHEYFVLQSEFYTEGEIGTPGRQGFSSNKGFAEKPEYVVFNGHTQALVDERKLKAKVGETVRLYVGNAGPNLISSFHLIGEIFDRVYKEGSMAATGAHVQTTMIPAGGAAIVEFKLEVPGDYAMVDHSIFRIDRGALGILNVSGDATPGIFRPHKPGAEASGH
jgi:nitrite reductase (NO-forming)